jgi:hypothetical protein
MAMIDNHEADESGEIPEDFLVVHGKDIDGEQLSARVVDQVMKRRAKAGFIPQRFPSYDGVPYPDPPEDGKYDPDLYHHLRLANKSYLEVKTEPELLPSPVTRIPIIGQLWSSVRGHAHALVLFYVNRAVRHEVGVNRYIISVLNSFAIANQDQQKIISKLESEIEELRKQLDR